MSPEQGQAGHSFLSHPLAIRLEGSEAWGIAQFTETLARMKPTSNAAVLHLTNGTACFNGVGSPLTCITGLGMCEEVSPKVFDLLETFLLQKGALPVLKICPFAHPSLLPMLHERGHVATEFVNTLYRTLTAPEKITLPTGELTVGIATDEEADTWVRTVSRGFHETDSQTFEEIPRDEIGETVFQEEASVCVLARVGGVPAGGGSMSIHNGVAALFAASTLPDFRRRGVHTAMIGARLAIAQSHGCDVVRYEATPGSGSHRNAERQGFRVAYTRIWMKKLPSPEGTKAKE